MKLRPIFTWAIALSLCAGLGRAEWAHAGDKPQPVALRGSGLPLPRFASLRSDEVNVRTGPGTRYPIDWVFKRKLMPVEIIAEYENYRKIRDWQGAGGWVHQSLLTGKRGFIVAAKDTRVFRTPAPSAEVVARLDPEVMGEIRSCQGDWCRVSAPGISGWVERTGIWGVYKSEPVN